MSEPLAEKNDATDTPAVQQGLNPAAQNLHTRDHHPGGPVSNWLSQNRWFTKEPLSYTGYQFFRSSIATIPYGIAMAAVHHVFGLLSATGQKIGLTDKGIDTFTSAVGNKGSGLAAVEKAALENAEAIFKPGTGAMIGRNMMRLGNSPLNPALQIAAGFTLFRFTGNIIKNVRDRVMNEDNTPEQTAREVQHVPKTIRQTAAINWPAESTGTPIAALVLGFMNAAFTASPESVPIRDKSKPFFSQVKEVWGPKSKLLQHAGVWTLSYSLFFLLAECLFKDTQIRRGLWKGHPNSLKNGPDDTVGGPGAIEYVTPDPDPAHAHRKPSTHAKEDPKAEDSQHQLRYPILGEPSIGRFILRRVIPVGIGISAYAALKRPGYLVAGGPMKQITVEQLGNLDNVGKHLKFFGVNSWREGLATTMFGSLWWAADAGGSFYDKFVHNLQQPGNAVPLNSHQQMKHAELLGRLNQKEQGAGHAA